MKQLEQEGKKPNGLCSDKNAKTKSPATSTSRVGVLNEEDKGKKFVRYDHFYADGKDGSKTEYDGVNVIKLPVGGSAGMSYDETKMVIDSTEDLHHFLEGIGVELNICSSINPSSDKIKRIELDV